MSITDMLQTAAIFGLAVIQLLNVRTQNNLIKILESVMTSSMQQVGTIGNIIETQNDMLQILRQLRNRL